jgi:Rrf2 family iron-sulfur cluster assembly transcriptional regulator
MRLTLTRGGSAAIRAAVDLARHPLELRKRSAMAEATGVSPDTLAHVLGRLRVAGLVESAAGPLGGYHLARPPAGISVLEVIEAAEGDLWTKGCPLKDTPCDGSCAIHPVWHQAQVELREALAEASLADVAAGVASL